MKRIYLAFLLAVYSNFSHATDWAILDGDAKTSNLTELDMDSIQQFATLAKTWVRITYPKPVELLQGSKDKYYSVMYRMIIDCRNARYVFSNSILYSQPRGRGEVLGSTKINEREAVYQMKDIAPDTVASAVLHYACTQASTAPTLSN
jgi:hypothetical protein